MKPIFIGVDGGGTKTQVLIEDEAGVALGSARSGPGNIRSVAGAWESVNEGIETALRQAGIDLDDPHYEFHLGLGLAGTEIHESREAFLKVPHRFKTLVLGSDGYAACLGVHGKQDGAVIIVGTGMVGFQLEHGELSRVGGFGFPAADEGAGAWLGMEALRLAFKALDGRGSLTPLLQALLDRFHVTQTYPDEMVSFGMYGKPGDFASLAPEVLAYASKGDPAAFGLVTRSVTEVNLMAEALLKKQRGQAQLPLCLLGGISRALEPYLPEPLKARLVPRQFDAAKGAIFMLKKQWEDASC